MSNPCSPETIPEPFVRALLQSRVALFLGAGCSAEPPAELPTATQLADILGVETGLAGLTLEEIAERLWGEGGWQEFARALPRDKWRARSPNSSHRFLAELCKEGLAREVITTNWDILVESALSQIGQPYSVIVRAQSLDTEPLGSTLVIKVHGCIDHPEYIKATGSDVAAPEWSASWVSALFETVLRTRALLFAGYSGASNAATNSVGLLVSAGERSGFDLVVDHNSMKEMLAKPHGKAFLEALELSENSYLQCGADEFFAALRAAVFPFLVGMAQADAVALLTELLTPTQVPADPLLGVLNEISDQWIASGPEGAQAWLLECFSASQDTRATRPYIAIRPRRTEIGRCLAWIALGSWAGVLQMPNPYAVDLQLEFEALTAVCLLVVSPAGKRRDIVAQEVAGRRGAAGGLHASYIGVMFDGVGPIGDVVHAFSATRGVKEPSVARGGAVNVRWIDGNAAFELLLPGRESEEVHAALRAHLTDLLTEAMGES